MNIVLIFLFNLCYSIFSVFSLSLIAPFLSVLFGNGEMVTAQPELTLSARSVIDTFYYYMGGIIRTHGAFAALLFIAGSMIISTFFSNLFRYLGQYANAPIRAGIIKKLRKDLYHRILILPLSFYNKHKKGDILNRIGSDVQEVEWSVVCSLQMLFRDPLLLVVFISTLFSISPALTLLSMIILPPAGLLIARIGDSIKKNSTEAQQLLGRMSSAFDEAINGLRVIQGHNATDYADRKFRQMNERFFILNRRIFRKSESGAPIIELLCILTLLLVLALGTGIILRDQALSGELIVMFIVIFARVIPPAKSIVTSFYTVQKGMASAERIFQVIDAEEIIEEAKNPIEKKTFDQKIEYQSVYFSYHPDQPDSDVLKNISFTLEKGKTIALVGASGSGKSTIVDLLPRFYDIREGHILIDGIESNKIKISDLRGLFGIVNQDVTLFNDTVFNNITFGKEHVNKEEVTEAAKSAIAHDFIMEMENGYDTVIGDRGTKLSGGQRQRLSIARAILQNPQVLILDEATSALDTESEYLVQKSLQKLMEGRTTIVIAHRLSTIRHADRILFIQGGRITEQGTHEELMAAHGEYAKFCAMQESGMALTDPAR